MGKTRNTSDSWEDPLDEDREDSSEDEHEELSEEDVLRFGGHEDSTDVIHCRNCGAEVYEDSDRCPSCGLYIVRGHNPSGVKAHWPWWVLVTAVVLLFVVLMWHLR